MDAPFPLFKFLNMPHGPTTHCTHRRVLIVNCITAKVQLTTGAQPTGKHVSIGFTQIRPVSMKTCVTRKPAISNGSRNRWCSQHCKQCHSKSLL